MEGKEVKQVYRGTEYSVSFVPKLKIELAVPDDLEEKVLETLQNSANTGQIGDGKIFVFDIKAQQELELVKKEMMHCPNHCSNSLITKSSIFNNFRFILVNNHF